MDLNKRIDKIEQKIHGKKDNPCIVITAKSEQEAQEKIAELKRLRGKDDGVIVTLTQKP